MERKAEIFSFFSGAGFLDLGFEEAGFRIAMAEEPYAPFAEAYSFARDGRAAVEGCGVEDFLGKKQEMLLGLMAKARSEGKLAGFIGGPPCPDFSAAGKQAGRDGENGRLSGSYVRLIMEARPDFFLFENVKGLWSTAKHREYFDELVGALGSAYAVKAELLNALEFGVPQDRDRIMMFGVKKDVLAASGASLDGFSPGSGRKYDLSEVKALPWPGTEPFREHSVTECPDGVIEELAVEHWFRKNGVHWHPNAEDRLVPRAGLSKMQTVDEGDTRRKSYKRLHRWRYSPTAAYGNNEVHLHPYEARRLSVAEVLAVQGMPEWYAMPPDMTLTDKYKAAGNGVPFLMAKGVAEAAGDFLDGLA